MSYYFLGSSTSTVKSTSTGSTSQKEEWGKTKISVSIIGDAFVDLFCYLNNNDNTSNSGSNTSSNKSNDLPKLGGDVRINQPVKHVAGGSGINTATHLSSLIQHFPFTKLFDKSSKQSQQEQVQRLDHEEAEEKEDEQMDITLQTIVNQYDDYGRLLINHAKQHNFEIINCRRDTATVITNNANATSRLQIPLQQQETKDNLATGHCIVLVTQNERSFITHLGILEKFQPSHTMLHELVQCRSANPSFTNHHHHIHIAGYYNIPKFHAKNALKTRIKLIREKRRNQSHGQHVYTTTISLTPQYDATEKWSTDELFNLLPLVDFFILNFMEACNICKIGVNKNNNDNNNSADEEKGDDGLQRSDLLEKMADYFNFQSPQTYVIVTLGKHGAALLYGGEVVSHSNAPMAYDSPLDTTGAGDAFASGFIYGLMNWRRKRSHNQVYEIGSALEEAGGWNDAIEEGMKWGCAAGTATVMKAGASVPSSKHEIELLLHPESLHKDQVDVENVLENDDQEISKDHDDDYDSELDSDYDPDDDYDDDYYTSSYTSSDYSEDEEDDIKEKKKWV